MIDVVKNLKVKMVDVLILMFKVETLLNKTDYEWIRDALTRVGYENDIEPHDDAHYFVLNTYGNKVAVEFDNAGEFNKITEAE